MWAGKCQFWWAVAGLMFPGDLSEGQNSVPCVKHSGRQRGIECNFCPVWMDYKYSAMKPEWERKKLQDWLKFPEGHTTNSDLKMQNSAGVKVIALTKFPSSFCVMLSTKVRKKNIAIFAVSSLFPFNWCFTDKVVCVMTSFIKKLIVT